MSWWDDLKGWIFGKGIDAISFVLDILNKIVKIVDDFIKTIQTWLTVLQRLVMKGIEDIVKAVSNGINWLKNILNGAIQIINNAVGNAVTTINNFVKGGVAIIQKAYSNAIADIRRYTAERISGIITKIAQLYQILDRIHDEIEKIEILIRALLFEPSTIVELLFKGLEALWGDIKIGEPEEEEV